MAIKINNSIVVHDNRNLANVLNIKTVNGTNIVGSTNDISLGNMTLYANIGFSAATTISVSGIGSSRLPNDRAIYVICVGLSSTTAGSTFNINDGTTNYYFGTCVSTGSVVYGTALIDLSTGAITGTSASWSVGAYGSTGSEYKCFARSRFSTSSNYFAFTSSSNFDAGRFELWGIR